MTWYAIFREAWRDVRTGVAKSVSTSLLFGFLIALCMVLELSNLVSVSKGAVEFQRAGGSVFVVEGQNRVDGMACENLASIGGIRSSAALRRSALDLHPDELPTSTLKTFDVTPSFASLFGAYQEQRGVFLTQPAAEVLGVSEGDLLRFTNGSSTSVGAVIPWKEEDGRRSGFGFALFVPVAANSIFDECWSEIWPDPTLHQPYLLTPFLYRPQDDVRPVISQLNSSLGTEFEGVRNFENRVTRFLPALSAILGAGLGAASITPRRLELSSDLHAGVARRDLLLKLLLETCSWIVLGLIWLLPTSTQIILELPPVDRVAATEVALHIAVSGAGGALLSALVFPLAIQERHLFRHFKER